MNAAPGVSPELLAWLGAKGLSIELRDGRGRCLVATRAFSPGTLLLEMPPYAAVTTDESTCDACGTCHEALKRCTACRAVRYCSVACQKRAWAEGGHQAECRALARLLKAQGRTPPPTLRLLHRVFLRKAQVEGSGPAAPWEAPELVRALQTHRKEAPEAKLVTAAQMATLVCELARPELQIDASEAVDALLALMSNAHTVADAELRPLGRGLYPVIACANHSCAPTAALLFVGFKGRLSALQPLAPGDEVTISYIDLCAPAHARRLSLREGYSFDCACPRCEAAGAGGGGSEEDLRLGGAPCRSCGAPVQFIGLPAPPPPVLSEGPSGGSSASSSSQQQQQQPPPARQVAPCGRCGAEIDVAAALAAAETVEGLLKRSHESREGGRFSDAAREAQEALRTAPECSMPEGALSTRAWDELMKARIASADWAGALEAAEGSVPGYELAHGPRSPLTALQLATLGRLAAAVGDVPRAVRALRRAVPMLLVTHGGRAHAVVAEAEQSLREMEAEVAHGAAGRELGDDDGDGGGKNAAGGMVVMAD